MINRVVISHYNILRTTLLMSQGYQHALVWCGIPHELIFYSSRRHLPFSSTETFGCYSSSNLQSYHTFLKIGSNSDHDHHLHVGYVHHITDFEKLHSHTKHYGDCIVLNFFKVRLSVGSQVKYWTQCLIHESNLLWKKILMNIL